MTTDLDPIVEKYSQKEEVDYYSEPAYLLGGLYTAEAKLINRYFKAFGTILDIGCGAGREAFALAKLGFSVTGIDITPAMLTQAETASKAFDIKVKLKLGDVRNLEFEDEAFDSAIMVSRLIQHIPTRKARIQALKEINRVLKNDGVLIITSGKIFPGPSYLLWRAATKAIGKAPRAEDNRVYKFSSYGKSKSSKSMPYLIYYYLRNNFRYGLMPSLIAIKRRAKMRLLKDKYKGLEPGDDYFDYANPMVKSSGKLFAHHYSCQEMFEDLEKAGFTLVEHQAAIELECGLQLPDLVRKSAPLHYYIAKKIRNQESGK